MESLALVLTDAALADCIEQLGDHSENPTTEQLRAVLPGIVERHGIGVTRLMLASTVAGEANGIGGHPRPAQARRAGRAAAGRAGTAEPDRACPEVSDVERDAIKAKRQEQRRKKQADARTRREQSAKARNRA